MADLDFFFDPVCPWAWITSRWVTEVQALRDYNVSWKFISLKLLNEDKMDYASMPAGYKEVHAAGTSGLRVAAKARSVAGNDAVAKVYTALGTSLHNNQEREKFVADIEGHIAQLLAAADLPVEWASAVHDETFDRLIADETAIALERAGKDVGTPIITFNPSGVKEASFFGPVISTIPRGEDATKLWDAIETIATASGMAELKRSLRARPSFD
ncbi:unannotated protein [freshwater metagenome]|uniref:Unannotated protein n=1 Tax=freshwater metagenome TaxID=449393 RepID=A0A6J6ID36_9ZZZZ|nr:hypothetical protein [Actinomycetota bacterium]